MDHSAEVQLPKETTGTKLTRRGFLVSGAVAGGGLIIGFGGSHTPALAQPDDTTFAPNGFIRIAPDDTITLVMHKIEMGQGTFTVFPMLLAEELEVRLDQVTLEHAPADDSLYAGGLGFMSTGGSTSVRFDWQKMLQAAATARTLLIEAAAQEWGVPADELSASQGVITHAASGRSATYGKLAGRASTLELPDPQAIPLKDRSDWKLLGRPTPRIEAPQKVNGSIVYGIDVQREGMRVATFVTAPTIGARVAGVEEADALAQPGVQQVVVLGDAVAVVADHFWASRVGMEALRIDWTEGNPILSSDSIRSEMYSLAEGEAATPVSAGDFALAEQNGAAGLDLHYDVPYLTHAALEPLAVTFHVADGSADVWLGTQTATLAQRAAAMGLGLAPEDVRIHNHYIGGSFGRRLGADFVGRAASIARHVNGPLKVIFTREEDTVSGFFRPCYVNRIQGVVNTDGLLTGYRHTLVGSPAFSHWSGFGLREGVDADAVATLTRDWIYDVESTEIRYVPYDVEGIDTGMWRGVGPTHAVFVVESAMDEFAHAAGMDPVSFRRPLLVRHPRALAVLERVATEKDPTQDLGTRRGRGVAVQFAYGTYAAFAADVTVGPSGAVTVDDVVCVVDCGIVMEPNQLENQMQGGIVFGMSAALRHGLTIENGQFQQANFDTYPVMRISETPDIRVINAPSGDAPGGIGEAGTPGIQAAITNAIWRATGVRVRSLPVNEEDLRET